ncbi:SlyX family protein [Pseudomonas sp. Gutcm_11s]|uniref:SlyX family protein n=1 Tax=Pseudomonas sp. Gutcm_11s TaxID=3026088 RepID=UPI002360540C|nr:SlyX family protein [Pseudomonas sp. Gutcm_11s]MDD0842510.1 SlyX family protein [Pseudomonas sp. Gutcm_11s]
MDLESRVVELETRLAFQDDVIATLNDVVVEQRLALDRLQLQIASLARRQEDMAGQFGIAEGDAPPPHY